MLSNKLYSSHLQAESIMAPTAHFYQPGAHGVCASWY